jgi:hypothetical protein
LTYASSRLQDSYRRREVTVIRSAVNAAVSTALLIVSTRS